MVKHTYNKNWLNNGLPCEHVTCQKGPKIYEWEEDKVILDFGKFSTSKSYPYNNKLWPPFFIKTTLSLYSS